MKLNIQLECIAQKKMSISKMHGNKCSCTLKCELKNMKHFMNILYDNCIKETAK